MAKPQRCPPTDATIVGLKYFDRLLPLLTRLHDVGTEGDQAGNRKLFFDHYCAYLLLFLFHPIVTSLRAIQQASELKTVQKKLGCPRPSLGSLSEATQVFDPEPLKHIATELAGQLTPLGPDRTCPEIKHLITAVDGTVIKTLASVVKAAYLKSPPTGQTRSAWRLHTPCAVERGVPLRIDVTSASPAGTADERAVLRQTLEADRCYLMDRGYAPFALFNAIPEKGSSYVCRVRDNSVYEVVEERPLTAAARAAQVVSDQVIRLGQDRAPADQPQHPVRLVMVRITPHEKRGRTHGGTAGPRRDGWLRLATNRRDVPAEVIAFLYQQRWTIEIFFRFLKPLLGCRPLLSTDCVGVEIQAYGAISACLLIALWTGKKPTKRTYEMICWYFLGWADEEELLTHRDPWKKQDS